MGKEFYIPLNQIVGNSDSVIEKIENITTDKNLSDNLSNEVKKIKEAGLRLREMIIDVMDLSKLEMGNLELDLINFNLADAIMEVWQTVETFKIREDIKFQLKLADDLGNMFSDRNKVIQLLHNILVNASRFAPTGLIALDVIRNSVNERDWFIFTITTGIAEGKDDIIKIFESLEKDDNSTPLQYSGLGLGLSTDKQLCRMMEGDITMISEMKKGNIITIRLPANIQFLGFLKG